MPNTAPKTMLILRGIRNLLDEPSALAYAEQRGYSGRVLNVSGEAYHGSPQQVAALQAIRRDPWIRALYGFSGGGYNLAHILSELATVERAQIELVVCIGAPLNPKHIYQGSWELVYRGDPEHMDGPACLLGHRVSLQPARDSTGLVV